jgi:alkylation response protein AidB-like acyl-CoA dehydrogenase
MVVLCRTDPGGGSASLSQIIVSSDADGITIGPAEKKMGLNGSPTHAVNFDAVRVPVENLLGREGRGLQQTLETLDHGRIGIGALAVGLAQAAYEEAVQYAKDREAFGRPIGQFEAVDAGRRGDGDTGCAANGLLRGLAEATGASLHARGSDG